MSRFNPFATASTANLTALSNFIIAPLAGDLLEVPGIGNIAKEALMMLITPGCCWANTYNSKKKKFQDPKEIWTLKEGALSITMTDSIHGSEKSFPLGVSSQ